MARITEEEYFKLTGQRLPPKKELPWETKKRPNKMGNTITEDGYQSKLEKSRAQVLQMEQKLGVISELEEQKVFVLQDKFQIPSNTTKSWYETIRAITYKADFYYKRPWQEKPIVEDSKWHRTEVFKIKKKMFLKKYQDKYDFIETCDSRWTIKTN